MTGRSLLPTRDTIKLGQITGFGELITDGNMSHSDVRLLWESRVTELAAKLILYRIDGPVPH